MNIDGIIIREWYSVDKFLPGFSDWVPVRCINRDECSDFYAMAIYRRKSDEWEYFDENFSTEESGLMQVTHWCMPIELDDAGKFIK